MCVYVYTHTEYAGYYYNIRLKSSYSYMKQAANEVAEANKKRYEEQAGSVHGLWVCRVLGFWGLGFRVWGLGIRGLAFWGQG